jgi:hypothetical protein
VGNVIEQIALAPADGVEGQTVVAGLLLGQFTGARHSTAPKSAWATTRRSRGTLARSQRSTTTSSMHCESLPAEELRMIQA